MSGQGRPVELLFLWHHHQPDYRSPRERRAVLPWVRLHATKDYLDMALHLERHPRVRATFNFVPTLLDQLEAAEAGGSDALFDLLALPIAELTPEQRAEVAARGVQGPARARERWPRYAALCRRVEGRRRGAGGAELSDQELLALECWFLLAWLDPISFGEPEAGAALARDGAFRVEHREGLLALHARLLAEVLPAYRRLAARGQIELSASAYYHPILPLLVDVRSAARARPDLKLPAEPFAHPEDAEHHIAAALARHARAFGAPPAGMWPPEGSVSPEVAALAAAAGIRWLATDEAVLWRSRASGEPRRELLYQPWAFDTPAGEVALFFRDRELSDRIGFVYHHWNPDEAVADFLERVRRIGREWTGEGVPVVPVILDGENCWEYYPDDGMPFLEGLYRALQVAEDVTTVTPSEVLSRVRPAKLAGLHTGSWIDADFHIWIGHPEKNRAWDLLSRTRKSLAEGGPPDIRSRAWEHLAAAEGSDWFWWYGDDHYTADRVAFDRLFREHLQAAHEAAGKAVPAWLTVPVLQSRFRPGAVQRPIGYCRPVLDGERTQFFEWHHAGRYRLDGGGTAMHRGAGVARELYYGFDEERFYLRLDFHGPALPGPAWALALELLSPLSARVRVDALTRGERAVAYEGGERAGQPVPGARVVIGTILELAVPFAALGLEPGQDVEMLVQLLEGGEPAENLPGSELLQFTVPDDAFVRSMWSV
jgi:alpha-amylase/alpha-mannosidase (GH57 family)